MMEPFSGIMNWDNQTCDSIVPTNDQAINCFLKNAADAIRFGCSPEYDTFYHDVVQSNGLHVPLERAILMYDIQVSHPLFVLSAPLTNFEASPPNILKTFSQSLVFFGLSLFESYDSPEALNFLAKDQSDLLESFEICGANVYKMSLVERETPTKTLQELQAISLIRGLFEFGGGVVNCRQHFFSDEFTINDNVDLLKTLIGITDAKKSFGDFEASQLCRALSRSKVFQGSDNITSVNMIEWRRRMIKHIPISYLGKLVCECAIISNTINDNRIFPLICLIN